MTIVADSWNTVSHYYLFSLPLFIMKTHSALTILCLLCTIHCIATPQKAVSDTLLSARFNRILSSSATEASRIAYIDLSNSKGDIVKQVKYPLDGEYVIHCEGYSEEGLIGTDFRVTEVPEHP